MTRSQTFERGVGRLMTRSQTDERGVGRNLVINLPTPLSNV